MSYLLYPNYNDYVINLYEYIFLYNGLFVYLFICFGYQNIFSRKPYNHLRKKKIKKKKKREKKFIFFESYGGTANYCFPVKQYFTKQRAQLQKIIIILYSPFNLWGH